MNASERYNRTLREYRETQKSSPERDREKAGRRLRDAALDRADRREWAHKRRGDERRWTE